MQKDPQDISLFDYRTLARVVLYRGTDGAIDPKDVKDPQNKKDPTDHTVLHTGTVRVRTYALSSSLTLLLFSPSMIMQVELFFPPRLLLFTIENSLLRLSRLFQL